MLRTVDNLLDLISRQIETAQQHPIVKLNTFEFDYAILKAQQHALNEFYGYRLAELCGVRTPRMQAVLCGSGPTEHKGCEFGSIGLLVEYFADWRLVHREEAASKFPAATGAALALCAFDRDEWGEFGASGDLIYFVDLECILPRVPLDDLTAESKQGEFLYCVGDEYLRMASCTIDAAIKEAKRLNVLNHFGNTLYRLNTVSTDTLRAAFDIAPDPLSSTLTPFIVEHVRRRLEVAMASLRIETQALNQ